MYPVQTSFGAPVFKSDANGEYLPELGMAGPEGEAFAKYLKKLADDKVVSVSLGGDQAKQAFLDQKTPYIITGPWNIKDFQDAGIDVSVLAVPSAGGQPSAPFLGIQGVYLSSQSKNALLANQFLEVHDHQGGPEDKLYELGGRMYTLKASADAVSDEILKGFGEAGANGQRAGHPADGRRLDPVGQRQAAIIDGKAEPVAAWQEMIANLQGPALSLAA